MVSLLHPTVLDEYFEDQINAINVSREETRAYIKGIFSDFIRAENDLSKDSVTIKYYEAKLEYNFNEFRKLADWIFWTKSIYPAALDSASPEFYDAIAQNSYYRCHLILNKQWPLYEELADQFTYFVETIQRA